MGKIESAVRKVLRDAISENKLTLPLSLPLSLTYLINDVATDNQRLKMIAGDIGVYQYITNPSAEMTKLHTLKWKL